MTRIIWKFYDYKVPRFERLLWEATTSRQTGTCEMHLVPSALLTASILSSATLRAGGDRESVVCNIYFSSFQYHRGAAGRYCFPHKRRNLGQFWPSGKSQLNPDQWNIWVTGRRLGSSVFQRSPTDKVQLEVVALERLAGNLSGAENRWIEFPWLWALYACSPVLSDASFK